MAYFRILGCGVRGGGSAVYGISQEEITQVSALFLPICIMLLIMWSFRKRCNVYEAFVTGAKDALPTLVQILPYMAAMLIAISVFRASGAMDLLMGLLSPAFEAVGMPTELVPLVTLRPFSGSAALALLQDVFTNHGVDTFIGLSASVLVGSTETIFYTVALYFGSVKVLKPRYSVAVALISGVTGVAAAMMLAYWLWG